MSIRNQFKITSGQYLPPISSLLLQLLRDSGLWLCLCLEPVRTLSGSVWNLYPQQGLVYIALEVNKIVTVGGQGCYRNSFEPCLLALSNPLELAKARSSADFISGQFPPIASHQSGIPDRTALIKPCAKWSLIQTQAYDHPCKFISLENASSTRKK